MCVTHFAFNFSTWCQGCHRVNDNHVYRTAAHQCITNFQSLFAIIWLTDQEIVCIDTYVFCVHWIERMLSIDKRCNTAAFLCFSHTMQSYRCLTRRFWPINFNDTPLWQTTYTKRTVQCDGTCWNGLYFQFALITQAHDGAWTKLLLHGFQCML